MGRKGQVRKLFQSPVLRGTESIQQVSEEAVSLCVPFLSPSNLWLQWTWRTSTRDLPKQLSPSHHQAPHFTTKSYPIKKKKKVTQSCPTLATPWTVAYQASPSMGFSRQEYWSGLPFLLRKAMVFSVVTYGCEICTIKKAGCQRGE